MSISKIELELPFGFQPDPILETATPEQRAIVLTTGCVALKALLFKTDSLSNEEAYKKATAEQAEKWLAEKSELEKKALREKKELEDKKAAEVRQLNDKLIAEQKKIKRKEEELTEADTLRAKAEREAETLRKRESQTLIDERTRTRSQVESENSREIEKLTQELKETKSKIEETEKALREALKKAGDTALEAEKDKNAAVDKVREESTAKILALTSRQSNSSTKGQDYQKLFGELLHKVFGISPDYLKYEHRIKSGDHIIRWAGLKLMFENKYYETQVKFDEVEKAIKDFTKHIPSVMCSSL
jgi:chromosome segregation ATPase